MAGAAVSRARATTGRSGDFDQAAVLDLVGRTHNMSVVFFLLYSSSFFTSIFFTCRCKK